MSMPAAESLHWFTSKKSTSGNGCVAAAHLPDGGVAVRHSQRPGAEVIEFSAGEWDGLLDDLADRGSDGYPGLTRLPTGQVMLRNSQRPDAEMIEYSAYEWDCFVDGVLKREFVRPSVAGA